ncbi:MAG TPA: hypothetical protein VGM63_16360 [Mucilaginibacter sp.]|jgi:hypothetical protein
MNERHLTEAEIQDCALGTARTAQVEHLSACALCHTKVTNYRTIFAMVDELQQPALDFDVEELVMARLPHPAVISPSSERWAYLVVCFVLALLFVPLYLYRDELLKITRGMQPVALCLTGLTALVVLGFQVADLYRNHLRKINTLISGDLQL